MSKTLQTSNNNNSSIKKQIEYVLKLLISKLITKQIKVKKVVNTIKTVDMLSHVKNILLFINNSVLKISKEKFNDF